MITNFSEQVLRITSDANLAMFIEHIAAWIRFNASKADPTQRNFHEGRYWTYSSYSELVKYFGGLWSIQTIRTMVNKCIKLELLISSNFNKKKYDNTNWYTLSDKALQFYPVLRDLILNTPVEINRPLVKINRPIPEDLNSLRNNTNSESTDSRNSSSEKDKSDYSGNCDLDKLEHSEPIDSTEFITKSDYDNNQTKKEALLSKREQISGDGQRTIGKGQKASIRPNIALLRQLIDCYREIFPNNPQPHARVISTSLQKTLSTLIKRWPELDPQGREITVAAFRRYLQALHDSCPKFSRGEYITESGIKKKNNLETFARWNTIVKFLENAYS